MATQDEIQTLMAVMQKAHPAEYFQQIDKSTAGIRAILKYLSEVSRRATAGEISRALKVSTARVAVLLKKMVSRGLLEKESDPSDGRLVVVRLSPQGEKMASQLRGEMQALVGTLIDEVGMEQMLEFAAISCRIHEALEKLAAHCEMQPK